MINERKAISNTVHINMLCMTKLLHYPLKFRGFWCDQWNVDKLLEPLIKKNLIFRIFFFFKFTFLYSGRVITVVYLEVCVR